MISDEQQFFCLQNNQSSRDVRMDCHSILALFLSVKPDKDDKQAEERVSVRIYQ